MKLFNKRFVARLARQFAGLLTAVLLLASTALAGPPLICHTIEIGVAKSLPWTGHGWNLSGSENYDTMKLASDTIAILDSGAPVLVRMETLRRATIYARNNSQAARELLTKLVARTAADHSKTPDALAYFDAGYLIECYKQWIGRNMPHMTDGMPMDPNPAAALDGYALVKKALAARGNDPQMEFAAALVTLDGSQAEHREHVAKAVAGAKDDTLLAQNLKSRFLGDNGMTVAQRLEKPQGQ